MTEENELSRINEGITDITTIESLDMIQTLNLHSNLLFGLKGLVRSSSLTELNLSSNRFEDSSDFMELSQLPNLKSLDLSGNTIKSFISFPYMPSMEYFSIAFNELTSLEGLDCFPSLISLDARGNLLANVIGFSVIETLSALKDLELSSEDGRHSNPICHYKGDILQIFDFSYFGRIDQKSRQEWDDLINPQPQKRLVSDTPPATTTPRVDAMLEKYRRGLLQPETKKSQDFIIYESDDDDDEGNILPVPRPHPDKDQTRGINHPLPVGSVPRPEHEFNPWNRTYGVTSTLAQRSDLIRKQLNGPGPVLKPTKDPHQNTQFDQMSDTPSDLTSDWTGQPLPHLPSRLPLALTTRPGPVALTSNSNLIQKNLLQLSISILKVWNRFHSTKLLRSFWFYWKSLVSHERNYHHITEMTVENNLLRSTISLLNQKNEEKEKECNRESDMLISETKKKLEREYSEKCRLHEKILDSKNKDYQQLSKMYNELEKRIEGEKALREREQESRLKEKEIEENEMILLAENRTRELNEMKKEMRERELEYEAELRRLKEESEEKRRQYERLIQLLEEEIKVRREEWREREKEREKERDRDRERLGEKESDLEREREKERERVEELKDRVTQYKEKMNELEKRLDEKEEALVRERSNQKRQEKTLKKSQEHVDKITKEKEALQQSNAALIHEKESDEEKIKDLREILQRMTTRCKEQEKRMKKLEYQEQQPIPRFQDEEEREKREEERRNYENQLTDWKEKYEGLERNYQNLLEHSENEKRESELTLQIKEQMIRHHAALVEDMREKKRKEEAESEERRERERGREKEEIRTIKEKFYELENDLAEERKENKEMKKRYKGKIQEMEMKYEEEIEKREKEITQLKKFLEQKERDIELVQAELIGITDSIQRDRLSLAQKEEICSRLTHELKETQFSLHEMQLKYDREKDTREALLGEVNELRNGVIANKKQYEKKFHDLKKQLFQKQSELDYKAEKLQKIETLFTTFQQLAEATSNSNRNPQFPSTPTQSQPHSAASSLSLDSLRNTRESQF